MEARLMTWNLWWQFGPWRERQGAILATIRQEQPDIVCLQEVFEQEGGLNQAAWIAEELGLYVVHTEGPWYDGISFGNAILSRWPLISSQEHRLPQVDGLPGHRRAITAEIDTPYGRWWVVSTHLDHKFDASVTRLGQCEALCSIVDSLRRDPENESPVLMAGDFNAVPDSDEIRMLTGRKEPAIAGLVFTDAWEVAGEGDGFTWRRDNPYIAETTWPNRRLDYVFVSWPRPKPMGNPVRAWLAGCEAVDGVQPSDHAALVVDLQMISL